MRALLAAVVAVGCGVPDPVMDPAVGPDAGTAVVATYRSCTGRAFTPDPSQSWRHDIVSPIVTAAGAPNHLGRDLVVEQTPGTTLRGKFTYGLVSKDLEDEDVRVWIDDCAGWVELGDFTTDSDGQIAAALPLALGVGAHDVRYQVLGDRSTTISTLWVLPRGTHVVVTDIDGTLTTSDAQLFEQILDGSHVPVAYPGAVDLAAAHLERGQIVMYLTGRPDWLSKITRTWLAQLGFAPGPLRVTDANTESLPTESSVGDFKKRAIASLLAAGYVIDDAYGNASTDIYAYLGGPLAADDVWIIGAHGGERGTHAVGDDWRPRAADVRAQPDVVQPYDR